MRAWYHFQANDEREARKVAESDMKGYMDRVNALRDQVYATQAELESRNKEVKKMQEKFEEWQDYISIFDV